MTIAHLLEDFGSAKSVEPAAPDISEEQIEEQRLVSFEKGFSAGWEDAIAAKDKETTRISATLANSLEDLNFTFHEAQSQLIETLDPMFKVLTSAVLPDTMAATFGHHIIEQLTDMARTHTDQPMKIVVSSGEGDGVRALLPENFTVPVSITEDAQLTPGQAYLRVGDAEREINSDALIASITDSIDAFSYQMKEDREYG